MTIQEYDIQLAQKETEKKQMQKHFEQSLNSLKDFIVKECEHLVCNMIGVTVKENPNITKEIGIDGLKNLKIAMNKIKNEVSEEVNKDIANNQKINSVDLTFWEYQHHDHDRHQHSDPHSRIKSFIESFFSDRIYKYKKEVNILLEQYHYPINHKGYFTSPEMESIIEHYASVYYSLGGEMSKYNSLKKAKEEQEAANLWEQA